MLPTIKAKIEVQIEKIERKKKKKEMKKKKNCCLNNMKGEEIQEIRNKTK